MKKLATIVVLCLAMMGVAASPGSSWNGLKQMDHLFWIDGFLSCLRWQMTGSQWDMTTDKDMIFYGEFMVPLVFGPSDHLVEDIYMAPALESEMNDFYFLSKNETVTWENAMSQLFKQAKEHALRLRKLAGE